MLDKQRKKQLHSFLRKLRLPASINLQTINTALTHSSYINESKYSGQKDNETLEFLGDSVLNLIVSHYLYSKLKTAKEGELSKIKAAVVSQSLLGRCAERLELGKYLNLGKGEEKSGGRKRFSILADTLEALIAAVYLEKGFQQVFTFSLSFLKEAIEEVLEEKAGMDYKTLLQEIVQRKFKTVPQYRVISERGPEHHKFFEIEVFIDNVSHGVGSAGNKKGSEQMAAKAALEKLK